MTQIPKVSGEAKFFVTYRNTATEYMYVYRTFDQQTRPHTNKKLRNGEGK